MSRLVSLLGWGVLVALTGAFSGEVGAAEPSAPVAEVAGVDAVVIDGEDYRLEVSVSHDAGTQEIVVEGRYETTQPLRDDSFLSYQVYGTDDSLLMADGVRFPWEKAAGGGRSASFQLHLPVLAEDPGRTALRVQFNAVVEGEFWYRGEHPEIVFPAIDLIDLPRRDEYAPGWVWIPRILPAQTRCRIPAWWSVRYRDDAYSGFVPALDVKDAATNERVESKRSPEDVTDTTRSRFSWLSLSPTDSGQLRMRPGLVWDHVRWYDVPGWFEYQDVRVVPPLWFATGALLAVGLWLLAWSAVGGWFGRWIFRPLWVVAGVWLAANLVVTGYWIPALALWLVRLVRDIDWRLPGTRTYAVVWVFLACMELYWGRMSDVLPVNSSALALAAALWALVLLPLLWIKRRWLRWSIAGTIVGGWLLATTVAVIYHQFFQDIPSVENLLYANQVGELGDSIVTLIEQRHLIPAVVAVGLVAVLAWPGPERRRQRKTQAENR